MQLTVIGCGDAFGSGGRLQTAFHVATGGGTPAFLIDCGATTIMGLGQAGLSPNDVGTVYLSHLHGDHFSGLVWWLIHAQHVARRETPLTIVGPAGTEARLMAATEALFPGASTMARRYELRFLELGIDRPLVHEGISVRAFEVDHPSGSLSAALRFELGDKVLAFSGDTQWTESLVACSADADLFLLECYAYERPVPYHLSWRIIEAHLDRLTAKRILLTHMHTDMLAARSSIRHARVGFAEDGLVVAV